VLLHLLTATFTDDDVFADVWYHLCVSVKRPRLSSRITAFGVTSIY
jgi:hypothetical protein